MVDVGSFYYWVQNPRFRLFPEEDTPAGPQWCEESAEFIEWANTMLGKLSRDPKPLKIAWAEWKVYRQYRKRYRKVGSDHRAEYNLDRHLCIHQAFLLIGDQLEDMELATGIPDLEPPPPLGQLQRSSVRGTSVEQSAHEVFIHETLLDFLENPFKLLVPEISPPIITPFWGRRMPAIMPKKGEQPAPEPGEQKIQPERIGISNRGAKTLFRRDDEQALSNRVAELERQLTEERHEKAELQRQLTEERHEKAELQRQLAQAQAKQARQRAKANERQKQWREQNPDRAREQHTKHMRSYRARTRGQDS